MQAVTVCGVALLYHRPTLIRNGPTCPPPASATLSIVTWLVLGLPKIALIVNQLSWSQRDWTILSYNCYPVKAVNFLQTTIGSMYLIRNHVILEYKLLRWVLLEQNVTLSRIFHLLRGLHLVLLVFWFVTRILSDDGCTGGQLPCVSSGREENNCEVCCVHAGSRRGVLDSGARFKLRELHSALLLPNQFNIQTWTSSVF